MMHGSVSSQKPAIQKPSILGWQAILGLGIALALMVRWDGWSLETHDFRDFLNPWYQFIRDHDRFWALKENFFNYNPPYIYLLIVWSYLFPHWGSLAVIKSIALVLDTLGTGMVYRWIAALVPEGGSPQPMAMRGAALFMIAPTIVLNGSYWGQCDMAYTTAVILSLYGFSQNHNRLALATFALALTFKLQAIFTAPVVLILLLQKQVRWRDLWIVPAVYGLSLVPAAIAGRPWDSLLAVYWQQFNTYQELTMNAPSLYQWFPEAPYGITSKIGLGVTGLMTLGLVGAIVRRWQRLNPVQLIQIALGFNLILPWLLPKMHDRYWFCADVLSFILAFAQPQTWPVAVATMGVSTLSYTPYLLGKIFISMKICALVLGFTGFWFWRYLWHNHPPDPRGYLETLEDPS
jgi:Gpi18-like mannosyltransferase